MTVFTLLTVAALLPGAPAGKARDAEADVRAKLSGYWQELDPNVPEDKRVGPNGGITWEVFPAYAPNLLRLTDFENEAQQWGGDGVLNAKADPMWLDVRYTDAGKEWVQVGVFKFAGDRILWVRGERLDAKAYDRAKGDVPDRPKEFTTPEGRPRYVILEPFKPKK